MLLLGGDKFIPHLRQPGFTYSACGPFTKNKERIQKFKETGDSRYIYDNEVDKVCFQHDMAYGEFKDLTRRIASDKVLRDKAFNITKYPKYNIYKRQIATIVYKVFDEKIVVEPLHLLGQKPQLREIREINLPLKMRIFQTKNQQENYTNQ